MIWARRPLTRVWVCVWIRQSIVAMRCTVSVNAPKLDSMHVLRLLRRQHA